MLCLAQRLDSLEDFYGPQTPDWPSDPYRFLVWWHCGYPASDARCAKGWASLAARFSMDPPSLLAANPAKLATALKSGGMFPDVRAMRLKEIAERVEKKHGGDLGGSLRSLPVAKARASLRRFPGIADPGVDRILLFAGISPIAAVPSNCPYVVMRIESGDESANYGVTYAEAERIVADGVPDKPDARIRAYLLLKRHGQQLCKRAKPNCGVCPVAESCAFAKHATARTHEPGKMAKSGQAAGRAFTLRYTTKVKATVPEFQLLSSVKYLDVEAGCAI